MKYLYIALIIIVLYYIISSLSENYSSSEHFDPSLVPVSSIVTLAKVAQKLVDGNGTLTNPGNLQLGTYSAPGNLAVSGNTILGGPRTDIAGITTINSDTIINNRLNVGNGIYIREGNLALNNGTINMISDGTGGLYLSKTSDINGEGNRLTTGPTTINGKLDVKGPIDTENANINGDLNIKGSSTIDGNSFVRGNVVTGMVVADNRLHLHSNQEDIYLGGKNGVTIEKGGFGGATSGNLNVGGNVDIRGKLNTKLLTHDDFLRLKLLLKIYRWNETIKGALFCSFETPAVLVDSFISDRGHQIFPIKVGKVDTANNATPTPYIDDNDAARTRTHNTSSNNDRMNYVYLYPGFGFKGWNSYGYRNDDNTTNPIEVKNTSSEIRYYSLRNGMESTNENIDLYGINLWNNEGNKTNPNLPEMWKDNGECKLSSWEVYKL